VHLRTENTSRKKKTLTHSLSGDIFGAMKAKHLMIAKPDQKILLENRYCRDAFLLGSDSKKKTCSMGRMQNC